MLEISLVSNILRDLFILFQASFLKVLVGVFFSWVLWKCAPAKFSWEGWILQLYNLQVVHHLLSGFHS